jgi:uncharacterized protein YqeY
MTEMTVSELKDRLRADLTDAMKKRDELRTATLRMAMAAVKAAEVAGRTARELSDDDVRQVLSREVRQRKEAAEAFASGNRPEQAARESDGIAVLTAYLPEQLSDEELTAIIESVVASSGLSGPKAMGQAMKAAQAEVAGRAEGARVASLVRARLAAG